MIPQLKVGAVVVTFNKCAFLKENLQHLLQQSYPLTTILVVDNHSDDETSMYMRQMINDYPQIKYLRLPCNIGGAGGFHDGIQYLFKHTNVDMAWLMDDDTMPTVDALQNLMIADDHLHHKYGFLASNVRFPDGHAALMNVPRTTNDWNEKLSLDLIKVKTSTFVSFLVSRQVVVKVGLPIKDFFIWSDDTEYSERISQQLPSYLVPNSIIIHKMAVNRGVSFNQEDNPQRLPRYFYSFRNNLYIERRHGKTSYLRYIASICLQILMMPFRKVPYRWRKVKILIHGLVAGIAFHPTIDYLD